MLVIVIRKTTYIRFKVDSKQMDLDDLCNEVNAEESINRVMQHWQKTRSPLVYWTRKMANLAETER